MSNLSRRLSFATALAAFGVSMPSISLPKYVKPVFGRMVHSGGTFNAGRNAEKRKSRADAQKERAFQVAVHQQSEVGVRHAPKFRLSALEMNMLADRRLRQRGKAA